ncbi:MAG: hypothetical protein VW270_12315 [Candidatus Poseidoniales archaeon]
MAKRKKQRAQQVSKGIGTNVDKKIRNVMRGDTSMLQRTINQRKAWLKGKNVMVTIPNPNEQETNKKFIRVNAKDVWGSPKKYIMKQTASE